MIIISFILFVLLIIFNFYFFRMTFASINKLRKLETPINNNVTDKSYVLQNINKYFKEQYVDNKYINNNVCNDAMKLLKDLKLQINLWD